MRHMTIDQNGCPTGFFSDNPPDGAIGITDAQWREFIDNAGLRIWRGGQIVAVPPPTIDPATLTLTPLEFWTQALTVGMSEASALAIVDAGSGSDAEKAAQKLMISKAIVFERASPVLEALAAAAGVSPAQLDEMFIAGQASR